MIARTVLLAALAAPSMAAAQGAAWTLHEAVGAPPALKLSGSFRTRYEAVGDRPRPGAAASEDVVSLRTTLFAEYGAGPVRIGAELYDSRAYGADLRSALTSNDVNAVELVQAYVAADVKEPFGAGSALSAQLGRFVLNLGSRRLVAADDYRNTTSGYTGLRLDARAADGTTATFIYTLPQFRLPEDLPSILDNKVEFDKETTDLVLWGGIAAKPRLVGKTMGEVAFYGLDEHDSPSRPTRDRNLRTVSARLIREPEPGRFDYEIEGAYQFGSIRADLQPASPVLDVSASFFHADAGYQFAGPWKPRVSLEYDRASGDDSKPSFGRFDTLFGMRRADFGPSGIYALIGRANISTPAVRIEATPGPRLDGFVNYRLMWLESATDSFSTSNVRDASGRAGSFAGQQLEGRVRYWLVPASVRLEANAALLVRGRFLKAAPNALPGGDAAYVAMSVTTTF